MSINKSIKNFYPWRLELAVWIYIFVNGNLFNFIHYYFIWKFFLKLHVKRLQKILELSWDTVKVKKMF